MEDYPWSFSFEGVLNCFVTGYFKQNTLISSMKCECGKFNGYPLDHDHHKTLLNRLVTTYHERRKKKKDDEVIEGIRLDECIYGDSVLASYPDVLDVQEKGVQVDFQDEKVFCSIGVQTDDILCSCDSFEGMIPYRKPVIQENHKYQTPKDLIQTQNVHVVESGFVHEVKSSRCKKMRKKKKKKMNRKNKRVYSQKSSYVVKPKSVKQIWVPKQQSPKVALNLKSKPKCVGGSFEDVLGSLKNTKNTKNELYISHGEWYNVQFGDFLIPTKEPRFSKFDSFVENGTRFVKKVTQILKWIPKRP